MVLGLRTVIYPAPDMGVGKAFYSAVLGIEPYFDEPFYVGYNASGFELGLVPDGTPGPDGIQAYWGVANIDDEFARLKSLGAECIEPVTDVGGGVRVAAVKDPFGNRFGSIENPVFDVKKVL